MSGLRRRIGRSRGAPTRELNPVKLDAITALWEVAAPRSFADLGGVWAVHGAYARWATERFRPSRGVLVDDDISSETRNGAAALPALELVEGNFADPVVVDRVGDVDAVLLFDVLLHQVAPDWDEVLALWAPHTRAVVVVEPHWAGEETVRLVDLGREAYLAAVPPSPLHDALHGRLEEVNPERGRPWRDVHDVWQWGITDSDLDARIRSLGFERRWERYAGTWRGLESFRETGGVWVRP